METIGESWRQRTVYSPPSLSRRRGSARGTENAEMYDFSITVERTVMENCSVPHEQIGWEKLHYFDAFTSVATGKLVPHGLFLLFSLAAVQ